MPIFIMMMKTKTMTNTQALEDVVALADVGQRPRRVVRVGSDEQVDAGAPDVLPLAELIELGARCDQHLAGPVADLGEDDAGGLASARNKWMVFPRNPAGR
jgi:hypothetical protein